MITSRRGASGCTLGPYCSPMPRTVVSHDVACKCSKPRRLVSRCFVCLIFASLVRGLPAYGKICAAAVCAIWPPPQPTTARGSTRFHDHDRGSQNCTTRPLPPHGKHCQVQPGNHALPVGRGEDPSIRPWTRLTFVLVERPRRALPTETKVESGTSQSKSETSVNFR